MNNKFALLSLMLFCAGVTAGPLGEVMVAFSGSAPEAYRYEVIDGNAVIEGDIILGKIKDIQRPGAVIVNHTDSYWPEGVIPFQLDESLPINSRANVYLAFVHYQKLTSIRFIERTKSNQVNYPDYVLFTEGKGCTSYVGKIGGEQEITLNYACTYGAVVHEIGHALGLWHEQNRADRDNFVRINIENIMPEYVHNFNQYLKLSRDVGAYDYESIMHYGEKDFSKNGKKTISVLDGKHSIGQRKGLSSGDVSAIKQMYDEYTK